MRKFIAISTIGLSLALVGCTDHDKDTNTLLKFANEVGLESDMCNGGYLVPNYDEESLSAIDKSYNYCKETDLSKFTLVEESAEGDHRVVIKTMGYRCILHYCTETGWEYYGLDYSAVDFTTAFEGLNEDGKADWARDFLTDNMEDFGQLKYEPAGDEFYFHGEDGYELFSEQTASLKDLELMGSKVEDTNMTQLGEKLAAEYGLSEVRGQEVAKTIAAYNKLSTKRALTASEKNQFSNSLLGVDYNAAERGIRSGDSNEFDTLMNRAAEANGTSPEAMSAIIRDMVL